MAKKTISFNIDEADLLKLDEYATNLERDRTYVLNQAIKMYIADAERERAEDEEAMQGPFYTLEQVLEQIRQDRASLSVQPKQEERKAS
jgi:predicted transcriptional regulator